MSVANVHPGPTTIPTHHGSAVGLRDTPRPWTVGQQVTVTVHRPLGGNYYLAQIAGRSGQVVASSVNLTAGTPLRAIVVAVGARLELKLLNPDNTPGFLVSDPDPETSDSPEEDTSQLPTTDTAGAATMGPQIDALSARYQVPLTRGNHARLAAAMSAVDQPRNMALGGLYLAKLGLPLTANTLGALYEAQDDSPGKRPSGEPLDLGALIANLAPHAHSQLNALIGRMDSTLNGPFAAGAPATAAATHRQDAEAGTPGTQNSAAGGGQKDNTGTGGSGDLARDLLNVPLGATVARHYGTFPVLVSGQLLELQFVAFQHRETAQEQNPVRRLFMTLHTPALGRLQIAAQAQGNRLSVTFTGESALATEALATHAPEVRELVGRLGWQVDSVVYGVGQPVSAAGIAMTQTLTDNTMDQLL